VPVAVDLLRPAPEALLSEYPRKKVLVVDDDDAIRTMVERVLRREQFDVESARDGFEAIEKLSRNDYATVLLDLMMPRVDGHGVLRFLETEKADAAPRVIVMTANMQGALESSEAPVVCHVIPKPFDIRQLISHVKQCDAAGKASESF
jgi:DNA-binding response OmpR family regulator